MEGSYYQNFSVVAAFYHWSAVARTTMLPKGMHGRIPRRGPAQFH